MEPAMPLTVGGVVPVVFFVLVVGGVVLAFALARRGVTPPSRAERRPPLDRVPVWVADALAVLSGLSLACFFAFWLGAVAWRWGPFAVSGATFDSSALAIHAVITTLVTLMLVLMAYDSLYTALVEKDPARYAWLAGILVAPPLAWVYYLRLWRPRRLGRGG